MNDSIKYYRDLIIEKGFKNFFDYFFFCCPSRDVTIILENRSHTNSDVWFNIKDLMFICYYDDDLNYNNNRSRLLSSFYSTIKKFEPKEKLLYVRGFPIDIRKERLKKFRTTRDKSVTKNDIFISFDGLLKIEEYDIYDKRSRFGYFKELCEFIHSNKNKNEFIRNYLLNKKTLKNSFITLKYNNEKENEQCHQKLL